MLRLGTLWVTDGYRSTSLASRCPPPSAASEQSLQVHLVLTATAGKYHVYTYIHTYIHVAYVWEVDMLCAIVCRVARSRCWDVFLNGFSTLSFTAPRGRLARKPLECFCLYFAVLW